MTKEQTNNSIDIAFLKKDIDLLASNLDELFDRSCPIEGGHDNNVDILIAEFDYWSGDGFLLIKKCVSLLERTQHQLEEIFNVDK